MLRSTLKNYGIIKYEIEKKAELKSWCIDNQPYYKKYIPEVVNYFIKKYNIK